MMLFNAIVLVVVLNEGDAIFVCFCGGDNKWMALSSRRVYAFFFGRENKNATNLDLSLSSNIEHNYIIFINFDYNP